MRIDNLSMNDVQEVIELVARCKPYVVPYNQYAYWILQNYFGSTCRIVKVENKIIGYISAMPSIDKNTVFIWQLCIDDEFRGKGLGTLLLSSVSDEAIRLGYGNLQLSISDTNTASQSLFKRFAQKNNFNMFEVERIKFGEMTEIIFQIDLAGN